MSSAVYTVTSNVALHPLLTTKRRTCSISVIVAAGADLGGGTLTLLARAAGSGNTPEIIDTLVAGSQFEYEVGPYRDIFLTMTGATDPDVAIDWSEIHS
jgi:hypothetical protein